jgi:hypothetical protein
MMSVLVLILFRLANTLVRNIFMKKTGFSIPANFLNLSITARIVLVIILTFIFGCNKNSTGNGNGGKGGGALLTKVVTVGYNATNGVVDSSVVTISYNGQKYIIETFQIEIIHTPSITEIDSFTTFYTYNGSLVSSAAQTISTQSDVSNLSPYGVDEQLNTVFSVMGGEITSLNQNGLITSYGINPPQNGILEYYGVLMYNMDSTVSSFTVTSTTNGTFSPLYKQTFTYSGNNLAGYILTNTNPAASGSTMATYTYNNHSSAAPFYNIIPGINLPSANDVSELQLVQVGGLYPGITTYTYNSSYNATNQPSVSSVTVSTTVTSSAFLALTPVTETINYYY